MAIKSDRKAEVIREFATHEGDTGSPEVQVALLTEDIKNLTTHLQANKKTPFSTWNRRWPMGEKPSVQRSHEMRRSMEWGRTFAFGNSLRRTDAPPPHHSTLCPPNAQAIDSLPPIPRSRARQGILGASTSW